MIGDVIATEAHAGAGTPSSAAIILPSLTDSARTTREIVMVAEVSTWGESDGTTIHYVGSHGLVTDALDLPAHTSIEGRLRQGRLITQSVPVQPWGMYGGSLSRDLGQIELINADGGLDALADRAVDGRQVVLKVGLVTEQGESYLDIIRRVLSDDTGRILTDDAGRALLISETTQLVRAVRRTMPLYRNMYEGLKAKADSWEFARGVLRLTLQDAAADLRAPIQSARYAGTGGAEGSEDLKDRTKPLAFGRVYQAEAVLIDAAQLIYQVCSLPIESVSAVYDRGVALTAGAVVTGDTYSTLVAASVSPGQYRVCRELGMIKLGSTPDSPVTVDLKGARLDTIAGPVEPWSDDTLFTDGTGWSASLTGPGYGETVADLIETILYLCAGWTLDRIDDSSFGDLRANLPYAAGIYINAGSSATIENVINEIAAGVGVAVGPDRLGRYRAVLIDTPLIGERASYTNRSIIEIERLSLPWRVPPREISVGYQRYWRTLGPSEVAAAVDQDRREQLGLEFRVATVDASEVVTQHPTSRATVTIQTVLATREGALAVAARLKRIYAPGRMALTLGVKQLFDVELADTIEVVHDRYALDDGRKMVVVSQSIDMSRGLTTLVAIG